MTFFELIKSLYKKTKPEIEANDSFNIVLNKWLSWDKDNVPYLKSILPYLFYVEPLHYFYLLYCNIPKKQYPPYLRKIDKNKPKDDKLLRKIQYILNWSNKELKCNMEILEATVLKDKKHWKKELGLV